MSVDSDIVCGPIITIDGPAGSGKTTTAKELASRLSFRHLDSGALYRAITYALVKEGIPPERWISLVDTDLDNIGVNVNLEDAKIDICLNGEPLFSELRTTEVTECVPVVASLKVVREWLLGIQRKVGMLGNLVADGRDMGAVVFPEADLKIFLVADLEARARRRLLQNFVISPSPEEIMTEAKIIKNRDFTDTAREFSPLRRPKDSFELDTTSLSFEEQVSLILSMAEDLTTI